MVDFFDERAVGAARLVGIPAGPPVHLLLANITSAERLRRAHALVGFPVWEPALVAELSAEVEDLTTNQRKNVIIGSLLDAAWTTRAGGQRPPYARG
jgi:hypothetical protein